MSQLELAMYYAKRWHGKQFRKYTGEPYIVHSFAVAGLVSSVTDHIPTIAAAFLHDTVEDTEADNADIETHFGVEVANLVYWVTDKSTKSDGNRAVRKELDRIHIAKGPPEAKTIKLADIIDNCKSIIGFDAAFARTYLAEKRKVLEVLTAGDPTLYKIAYDITWGN